MRRWLDAAAAGAGRRGSAAAAWVAAALVAGFALSEERLPEFANNYHRELAKDGLWSLLAAFRTNRLEFERFYPTMEILSEFVLRAQGDDLSLIEVLIKGGVSVALIHLRAEAHLVEEVAGGEV